MKIELSEEDYEALLDTIAFSPQRLFEKCMESDCPAKESGDPCYVYVKKCVEEEWGIEE